MRLSTATIIPLLAAGVAFTGAAPALADTPPNPAPPTTSSTMPQPGPTPGSGLGGQVGLHDGNGFGNLRPGHGFGDRNHVHIFRLHRHHRLNEVCFFVHRHVVIRIIHTDHRVVIIKTIVPGRLVCLNPFRGF